MWHLTKIEQFLKSQPVRPAPATATEQQEAQRVDDAHRREPAQSQLGHPAPDAAADLPRDHYHHRADAANEIGRAETSAPADLLTNIQLLAAEVNKLGLPEPHRRIPALVDQELLARSMFYPKQKENAVGLLRKIDAAFNGVTAIPQADSIILSCLDDFTDFDFAIILPNLLRRKLELL